MKQALHGRRHSAVIYRNTGTKSIVKATNSVPLCLVPKVVAIIISLLGHFSSCNLIIEISTGFEINEDLRDGVGISLGTPDGGLNMGVQGAKPLEALGI